MFCTKCGTKNQEGGKFCVNCGNPLVTSASVEQTPQQVPQYAPQQRPLQSQQQPSQQATGQVPQAHSASQQEPHKAPQQTTQQAQQIPLYAPSQDRFSTPNFGDTKPPTKKKPLIPILIGALGLVAIVGIILIVSLFSKKEAILNDIIQSVQNTLEAKNFEFTMDYYEKEYGDKYKENIKGEIVYDFEKKLLNLDMRNDKDERVVIYDENLYSVFDNSVHRSQDISDELDMIFDYFKDYDKNMTSLNDVDWKDIVKEAGLSSFVKKKELDNCIKRLDKELNSKAFYKEVCKNFEIKKTKAGTLYTFDTDAPKLIEAVLDILEPAIDYDIDDIKDELLDEMEELNQLELKLLIKDKKISSVEFIIELQDTYEDEYRLELRIEINNYGNAKLKEDEIKDLLDKYDSEAPSSTTDATNSTTVDESSTATNSDPYDEVTSSSSTAPEPYDDYATLDVWLLQSGESSDAIVDDSINRLKEVYPDYTINVSRFTYDEYLMQLNVAVLAGEMPDIFIKTPNYDFFEQVKNNLIYDITDLMYQDDYFGRFMDASISQITYHDRIYGIPANGGVYLAGFFYNKEIFEQFGFSEPTSISELEEICDTLVDNGITPFAAGTSYNLTGSLYYSYLALREGGIEAFTSAAEGNGSFTDACFVDAGVTLQKWVTGGYFNEGFNYMDDYGVEVRELLYNGSAAMQLMPSWSRYLYEYDHSDFMNKLGFFEFPAVIDGDSYSKLALGTMGDYYCISSDCLYPEAAFKLITYLVDDVAVENYASIPTYLPIKGNHAATDFDNELLYSAEQQRDVIIPYSEYLNQTVSTEFNARVHDLLDLFITPVEAAAAIQEANYNFIN